MISSSSGSASGVSRLGHERLFRLFGERERRRAQRLFFEIFPDEDRQWAGPPILKNLIVPGQTLYARHKDPKHLEFFAAGAKYRERCARCGNRVGKTLGAGGYETAAHLTGDYPAWWVGRRFDAPVKWWAAGRTLTLPAQVPEQAKD